MFETQKSGNQTSTGGIGLNIRTLASLKVGQDKVSGGVKKGKTNVRHWNKTNILTE